MSRDGNLRELGNLLGILPEFRDMSGQERVTPPETYAALARAMGHDIDGAALPETIAGLKAKRADQRFPVEAVVEAGAPQQLGFGAGHDWILTRAEDASHVASGKGDVILPPLAPDIYVLQMKAVDHAQDVTVLAAPRRLPQVAETAGKHKIWGMSAALYGLVSERNGGLGDYDDLGRAAEAIARRGAAFLGINPVHAMGYADTAAFSPYSPSHRGFLNTAHIALDQVPGASTGASAELRRASAVPYAAHKQAQQAALEIAWQAFCKGHNAEFEAFCETGGAELNRFAAFEALTEQHGPDWRRWPAVVSVDQVSPDRRRYHKWLQWIADGQLALVQRRACAAGMAPGLYLDLAVGARRDGAEAWCEADVVAQGVSLGAPPDHLSPGGQAWSLAAFNPHALRAVHYAPLRRILAQTMRHAGVIRIDHVLGLNRSYWVPDDGSAGAYVRQPFESLIALIKIEAARHGTLVIGEDLGLVPEGFRDTMRVHGFYGYSVLQYDRDRDGFRTPGTPSPQVLACFGTHDTPTLQGYANGRDIDWWQRLGWIDGKAAAHERERRSRDVAKLQGSTPRIQEAVHGCLAASPAEMVCVQLDDVLGTIEAQNLPGTVHEHQNWQRRYAVSVADLETHPELKTIGACMANHDRTTCKIAEGAEA
ncbi:4-alpha-glucanotransferase [Sedimentitalea todarodis]|uniref:4-alpha-glucanotransferase n=1 Tax=Sedimentitalea todarodis TaxID=1631240 RepID=A0ABU3VIT4_9RHOB|nr:4-alpha-glucanotransferase [Sedimentitalea todarodis]MDU9006097.1 4-alpha-glucanotransferase [Sedimentitalea todarodis]